MKQEISIIATLILREQHFPNAAPVFLFTRLHDCILSLGLRPALLKQMVLNQLALSPHKDRSSDLH